MNLSEFVKVKDYNFKLPDEFKECEGCTYFNALFVDGADCYLFGRINGVIKCIRKDDARSQK